MRTQPEMFDETNKLQMTQVADSIACHVPEVFEPTLATTSCVGELQCAPVHKLTWPKLDQFLQLLDNTIGDLYSMIVGPEWKKEKVIEMQETGLVAVWYQNADADLMAFVTFMLVVELGQKRLYLFEIHVHPKFQGSKLGSQLIEGFHKLARSLNSYNDPLLSCKGTSLTVFSKNERAFSWYTKLGYRLSEESPTDRTLRSGKIVKPDYYIMSRDNI